MFVPFFTSLSDKKAKRSLQRRKGGGGGGGGGGGRGGGGGSSSSGSRGGSTGGSTGVGTKGGAGGVPVSNVPGLPGGALGARGYGQGGGPSLTIPSGQAFAGRQFGGGSRDQIYGSKTYGSGYPGQGARVVNDRGFPFGYWPLAWGVGGVGGGAYLYNHQYGRPNNSSRPGGPLLETTIKDTSSSNTTYHLIADNSTSIFIIEELKTNCSIPALEAKPFDPDSNATSAVIVRPEQVIQYYRSSSLALTLDGYNNTAALQDKDDVPDVPLPQGLNLTFLDCLNYTIGNAAPIVQTQAITDGALAFAARPSVGLLSLLLVLAHWVL